MPWWGATSWSLLSLNVFAASSPSNPSPQGHHPPDVRPLLQAPF